MNKLFELGIRIDETANNLENNEHLLRILLTWLTEENIIKQGSKEEEINAILFYRDKNTYAALVCIIYDLVQANRYQLNQLSDLAMDLSRNEKKAEEVMPC